ncbi:hypothetical protein [Catenuloplanes japonicus]|uniref:hypothetical protein n=1 Tax=Catenuloplanes japonicus TaxID=33876 RepID=UPI000526F9A2|nr:hypothetical protein [Catenuloplanes japonicus]
MLQRERPQVFVDVTGRRKRMMTVAGAVVATFSIVYIAVIGASVVEASDTTGLSTRATMVKR